MLYFRYPNEMCCITDVVILSASVPITNLALQWLTFDGLELGVIYVPTIARCFFDRLNVVMKISHP